MLQHGGVIQTKKQRAASAAYKIIETTQAEQLLFIYLKLKKIIK